MYNRSKTMPPVSASVDSIVPGHITKIRTPAMLELERRARKEVEVAIRVILISHHANSTSEINAIFFFTARGMTS